MESTLQKTTALILGLGSLMFLVAAFLPYSRIFAESDTGKKLAIIMEMKKMWTIGQVLFGLGAVITVIALGILSYGYRDIAGAQWSHLGVLLMFAGASIRPRREESTSTSPSLAANTSASRGLMVT